MLQVERLVAEQFAPPAFHRRHIGFVEEDLSPGLSPKTPLQAKRRNLTLTLCGIYAKLTSDRLASHLRRLVGREAAIEVRGQVAQAISHKAYSYGYRKLRGRCYWWRPGQISSRLHTRCRRQKKVCLIDKAEFPRDKLCGGGLTLRSKIMFERIFRRPWKAELFISSRDVAFFSKGRFLASLKISSNLFFTTRLSFADYLLGLARDAGATLKLGDAVRKVDLDRQSIALQSDEDVAFRFLIGADGVNSIVAKTLFGKSFDPATVGFTLEAEVPRDRLPQHGNIVEIDFSAARWGYGWVFPKRDSVTIGIGGIHRLNPNLRHRLDEYFRRKGLDASEFKVKGQYIPGGDYRVIPGRSNVLLCGDAAGAVDPVSGEGIAFALQTGGAAGRTVAAALARPADRNALEVYREDYSNVVALLRRGKFWRRFIYPRLVEHLFAWAFRIEPARKRILGQG